MTSPRPIAAHQIMKYGLEALMTNPPSIRFPYLLVEFFAMSATDLILNDSLIMPVPRYKRIAPQRPYNRLAIWLPMYLAAPSRRKTTQSSQAANGLLKQGARFCTCLESFVYRVRKQRTRHHRSGVRYQQRLQNLYQNYFSFAC